MKAVLIGIAILSISAYAAAQNVENRKLWYDDDDASLFASKMKERNVPFHRDEQGGFWYPSRREIDVEDITKVVLDRCSPAASFADPKDSSAFQARLKRENISYKTCRHNGKEYVTWDPRFDKRAKELVEAVDMESMRRDEDELNRSH